MNVFVDLSAFRLPEQLMHEIARIFPAGRSGFYSFDCRLPLDDPRFAAIVRVLDGAGFQPHVDNTRYRDNESEYSVLLYREYSPDELAAAEYLQLSPMVEMMGMFRDPEGRIKLEGQGLKPDADFADCAAPPWVVVPDRVKKLLDGADFRGVVFRPTVLVGGPTPRDRETPIPWDVYGDPWWELTSDVILPPLAPSMELCDSKGRRLARRDDYANGCLPREGLYAYAELRYRAEDLRSVQPFDLALTREPFGNKGVPLNWRALVASRRFYEFCRDHGLKCGWVPVRVQVGAAADEANRPPPWAGLELLGLPVPKSTPGANMRTAIAVGDLQRMIDALPAALAAGAPDADLSQYLRYAAPKGFSWVIEPLAAAGAAIDGRDAKDGRTALHIAVGYGYVDFVRKLIERGADVNATFPAPPGSALGLAVRYDRLRQLIEPLLEAGADPNVPVPLVDDPPEFRGVTPLFYAAGRGDVKLVRLLIRHGANVDLPGPDGVTPLAMAASGGHLEVVKALVEAGADPTFSPAGAPAAMTAADLAEDRGHWEIAAYLRRGG